MATNLQEPQTQSTPKDLVNAMHAAFGRYHARAVHAKGIVLEGVFTPAIEAKTLTKAAHLQDQPCEVTVRFSDFTGIPNIPDSVGEANPRGMAIRFHVYDGTTTDIVAHSYNGFPVKTSDEFRELLLAVGASGLGASKPTKLDEFLASHPIAKTFLSTQHTPISYASICYFGVNSFKFTNKAGDSNFIRYQFDPDDGEEFYNKEEAARMGANYLQSEIRSHLQDEPVKFHLYAQVAIDGDEIDNPSIAWPGSRRRVLLGTIELDRLSSNSESEDKSLSFMPNQLPEGIEPADPMIDFRAKAYPLSKQERQ